MSRRERRPDTGLLGASMELDRVKKEVHRLVAQRDEAMRAVDALQRVVSTGMLRASMELDRIKKKVHRLIAQRDEAMRAVDALWCVVSPAEIRQLDADTIAFAKMCHEKTWHSEGH